MYAQGLKKMLLVSSMKYLNIRRAGHFVVFLVSFVICSNPMFFTKKPLPEQHETNPTLLINTLLLYIPLLALTDRITDGETNTLASRGLEEPIFQLCCCVSFLFRWEIGFGFTYYLCT